MADEQRLYDLAQAAQKQAVRRRRRKVRENASGVRQTGHTGSWLPDDDAACDETTKRHPALSPSQETGRQGEEHARQYLRASGLIILGRNLRGKAGEIDLVALDGEILVFIEVRQRHSRQYGGAAASVNRNKQRRLVRTAQYFLPRLTQCYFRGATPACRFDVVSVEPEGLDWIKDAFRE